MNSRKSKMWYLKQINLFNGMPPEMGPMVEEMTEMQVFSKGETIYMGLDTATHIYILKTGRVKIAQSTDEGKELIKAILYPGEIFGECGLSGAEMYLNEATALDQEVLVCAMDIKHLKSLMTMHPTLGLAVTASLGKKLARLDRKLDSLIFKDAQGRIVDLLFRMAKDYGQKNGNSTLIEHNLTHQDLANLTATSRQTVTTILNELSTAGLIRMERKKVFVKDINALFAVQQKELGVE